MNEILVSQDGATATVLPATTEEKARQVPDPVTFNLLCMLPKADEKIEGTNLIKTSTMMHHEELLSPVLFVAKMGPDAYGDESASQAGQAVR